MAITMSRKVSFKLVGEEEYKRRIRNIIQLIFKDEKKNGDGNEANKVVSTTQ
jgi:hypothetical protein